jgi:hypothetical protein
MLLQACSGRWAASFPVRAEGPARFHYSTVVLAPVLPLGGQRQTREADTASELLHRALQERAPFRVWDRLLDVPPAEVHGPLDLEGQRIDGLLTGRLRFSRRDRSTWDRPTERATESQGQPVFARKTAFRLDLRIELRNLASGAIDLDKTFSDEVVVDSEAGPQEREAFAALLGSAISRMLDELSPPPVIERRVLLPWKPSEAGGRP